MKKRTLKNNIIIISLSALAIIGFGFLSVQQRESRDFKLSKNLDILVSLFRELNTFYVDEFDPDKIVKSGIDNMLSTLDPYTVYYPESDADELSLITTGKYGGIGSTIRGGQDYCVVSSVYKGFPADKSGLRPGDLFKSIDGVDMKGASTESVSEKLKGEPGTDVKVVVESNGSDREVIIKREKVAVPPVPYYGMVNDNTGYICFTSFTQNCVQDVRNALIDLKSRNAQQIILDIRSNGGGLLSEAVEIVNLFVGSGNTVVSTQGKVKQFDEVYQTTKQSVDETIPLVVLINRGSASASEIVAGAIQDLDRGVIVGERSYGKGLVQVTRPLSYNTQLKVTTAKYYTPSGRCVQAVDYSHRNEDGSVGYVPDSLISEFKTRNGRTVKDGGGITPDVTAENASLSQLTSELYLRYIIFDYATKYFWSHPSPSTINDFVFTDNDYEDFCTYINSIEFDYKTLTERALSNLTTSAKEEKRYDANEELFKQLEQSLSHSLSYDLNLYKNEISELISEEIISRYFYEAGLIQWSIKDDEQIKEAINILQDKSRYNTILTLGSSSVN